jgi:hypothetical protein
VYKEYIISTKTMGRNWNFTAHNRHKYGWMENIMNVIEKKMGEQLMNINEHQRKFLRTQT